MTVKEIKDNVTKAFNATFGTTDYKLICHGGDSSPRITSVAYSIIEKIGYQLIINFKVSDNCIFQAVAVDGVLTNYVKLLKWYHFLNKVEGRE